MPHTEDNAPHILIVDDCRLDRLILAQHLQDQHYRISMAANGEQGYALAVAEQPDLILLDIRMPGIDGFVVCRQLKANSRTETIPVIFLTGADRQEERILGLSVGGVDVISKPFPSGELALRINIHLGLAGRGKFLNSSPRPLDAGEGRGDVLFASAIKLIRDELDSPLALEDIAFQLGTYGKRLNKIFRSQCGKTVFHFIHEERMSRAVKLLTSTELEVGDIAELTGFSSAANFATAFRRYAGATPTEYRQARLARRD